MENRLYQYSVLAALMHGIGREGIPLQNILCHGDHGIGTITGINGEIIILDGTAYHFPSDGPLRIAQDGDILPFAMVTRFQPTLTKVLPSLTGSSLLDALTPLFPSHQNHFLSIRLEAAFPRISFRVMPAQSKPGETLSDLARGQEIKSRTDTRGVLFGFWSPAYVTGFNVVGVHLHFLSEDRTAGGHVLDFEAAGARLQAAAIRDYRVELPASEEFQGRLVGRVSESEMHAAEHS